MLHVPIIEGQDRLAEAVSAAEAGEDVVITRDGREVARLVRVEPQVSLEERLAKQRAAIEGLLALREEMRRKGVTVSRDEWVEWKNEGRR
jgi:prevent-host-death family protein